MSSYSLLNTTVLCVSFYFSVTRAISSGSPQNCYSLDFSYSFNRYVHHDIRLNEIQLRVNLKRFYLVAMTLYLSEWVCLRLADADTALHIHITIFRNFFGSKST